MIIVFRTDKPQAELGLYEGQKKLVYVTWPAHRELAGTIHLQIAKLLQKHGKRWKDIAGIVCYRGPGSFTGLRIGLTVGNALSYGLGVPVVAESGENWQQKGITRLQNRQKDELALPDYGAPAHTTKPRK